MFISLIFLTMALLQPPCKIPKNLIAAFELVQAEAHAPGLPLSVGSWVEEMSHHIWDDSLNTVMRNSC